MMSDFTMVATVVSIIVMSSYAILGTVMHTKFIVEEYTGRKNVLLFTYPQKRSQILSAKFLLTFVFTFSALILTNLAAYISVGIIDNMTGLTAAPIDMAGIASTLLFSLILGLIANLIGIIALKVGFYKKSIIWTLLTAVILVSPLGNSVISFHDFVLPIFLVVGAAMLIICIILFAGLLKKVNNMECL